MYTGVCRQLAFLDGRLELKRRVGHEELEKVGGEARRAGASGEPRPAWSPPSPVGRSRAPSTSTLSTGMRARMGGRCHRPRVGAARTRRRQSGPSMGSARWPPSAEESPASSRREVVFPRSVARFAERITTDRT
uniref:Uncharacterized protein n=1 Tax=Leersia perrieri TaxID=77586 RepID=A0A0D9XZA0_9ORYZ